MNSYKNTNKTFEFKDVIITYNFVPGTDDKKYLITNWEHKNISRKSLFKSKSNHMKLSELCYKFHFCYLKDLIEKLETYFIEHKIELEKPKQTLLNFMGVNM